MTHSTGGAFSLVVLISGEGSNLQAIMDRIADKSLPVRITAVISNRAEAAGLVRARSAGIPVQVLTKEQVPDRGRYDQRLMELIDQYQPNLVVLAGFMRILTDTFVHHYHGKLINIHPSLLPDYKGLHTHQRVLDDKQTYHGATVHFVTPELDSGPIILQGVISIHTNDTAHSLQQRVHRIEHMLYPRAIGLIASGQVQLRGDNVYLDSHPITKPDYTIDMTNLM